MASTKVVPVTKLEAYRRAAGINRMRMARMAGIDYSTVIQIELHGQQPRRSTLLALSIPLGCKLEDLRGYVGDA